MPFAVFTRVREVSSEDSVHSAENLINNQPGKKWKTKCSGEKSAYVILEMADFHQITGIDIGNEHSAFVEVLVGKSSSAPEDFTDILITCSFMTPPESKASTNANRVRCFNQEALVPSAAANKWSFVKIVCTQPFNKHVQYGLSFIKVHVTPNQPQKTTNTSKLNLVPEQFLNKTSESTNPATPTSACSVKLKFRSDSTDSESGNTSTLFNRWKKSKDNESEQTAASSIRLASKSPITTGQRRLSDVIVKAPTSRLPDNDTKILDRNRCNLLFGDDDDNNDDNDDTSKAKKVRLTKQIEADKERRRLELQKQTDNNKIKSHNASQSVESKEKMQNESEKTNLDKTQVPSSSKKRQNSPSERSNKKVKTKNNTIEYRPFNQLLRGVVLVISGIQNPDRGDLRNKALALGAKYKGDWDNTCTHLICAFKNTPKYNQVRGKGKIVTRSWIEKCYSLKKYLPWRRYALDSNELSKPESDDEILDVTLQSQNESSNDSDFPLTSRRESEDRNTTLALYDIDDQPKNINPITSSGSDTDDEIQRVEQNNKTKESKQVPPKEQDIYEASTDEEDYLQEKLQRMNSLNFFKLLKFFICDNISSVDKIKLEKIIEQYAGRLTTNLSEAQYAVTTRDINSALTSFSGEMVRPLWIFECNELQTKLPTNRYLI